MAGAVILLIAICLTLTILIGIYTFQNKIKKQRDALFTNELSTRIIAEEDLTPFPPLMRNYLLKSGVVGKARHGNLTFQQKGMIKSDPKKKWMSLKATQYMSSRNAGFIWFARAFPVYIVDSFFRGVGAVKVNLLGLKNLALFSTPETHQSALGRYFGELLWFPIAFLDGDIVWETLDKSTVKGTIRKAGLEFTGYFSFSEDGWIHSFRGQRYRDTTLENFVGRAENYTNMNGLFIPQQMTAIWELDDGSFPYFKASIVAYTISQTL